MPTASHYRRKRHRLPLVLYTHPFELALGWALVVAGVRGSYGSVTPSLDALDPQVRALYLVVSTLGGVGVIFGVCYNDPLERPGLGLSVERAALYLVAASYAALAVLLIIVNGSTSLTTATIDLVVAAGCVLRTVAIRRAANAILAEFQRLAGQARRDREEDTP